MHPCFQGSGVHPGIFPIHPFMCIYWAPAGKAARIHSWQKKKFKNEVHRMYSPPPRPLISLPTPKELCSLHHLGEMRACSKLYTFGKGPQGALGVERNQLLCLSKSSAKSIVTWVVCHLKMGGWRRIWNAPGHTDPDTALPKCWVLTKTIHIFV